MDITKKLYLLAVLLVIALGFFAYHEGLLSENKGKASALKRAQLEQTLDKVINTEGEDKKDSFLSQVP